MPITRHHHQAPQSVAQAAVASHPPGAAPPWAESPIFLTFAPCFVVLVLLMIRHRRNLHRRGETFTRRKTKPAEYVAVAVIGGGLLYLRDRLPIIPLVMEWPDRHFAYYHAHAFQMWVGLLAAGLAASMIATLYAALFLRGGGRARGENGVIVGMAAGRHTLLPTAPPGMDWYSAPQITRRITRERTYRIEEK